MRTNIVIDDKLMAEALMASGAKTKREAVELGLHGLVALRKQKQARALRGRITWEVELLKNNLSLLDCDRDFLPFAEHLGLIVVDAEGPLGRS